MRFVATEYYFQENVTMETIKMEMDVLLLARFKVNTLVKEGIKLINPSASYQSKNLCSLNCITQTKSI